MLQKGERFLRDIGVNLNNVKVAILIGREQLYSDDYSVLKCWRVKMLFVHSFSVDTPTLDFVKFYMCARNGT